MEIHDEQAINREPMSKQS